MLFQMVQGIIIIALLFFVFDIRTRRQQSPKSSVPLFLGFFFPFYVLAYLLVLFVLPKAVTPFDWLALIFTSVGLALVMKARIDLRDYYAWPGFFKENTQIVRTGVYAYMRHPIYVGVYVFVFGTLLTVIYHAEFKIGLIVAMAAAALLASITVSARHEEEVLEDRFGEDYLNYKEEVYAGFPFCKRKSKKDK